MADKKPADNQDKANPFDEKEEEPEIASSVLDAWGKEDSQEDINEVELSDDPFDLLENESDDTDDAFELVEEEPDQAESLHRSSDAPLDEQIIELGESTADGESPESAEDPKKITITPLHPIREDGATATADNKPAGKIKKWLPWIAAAILIPVITTSLAVLIKAFTEAKNVKKDVSALQEKITNLSGIIDKLPRKIELDLIRSDIDNIHTAQKLFKTQIDDFTKLKDETTQLSKNLKQQLLVISEDRRSMINDLTGMRADLTKTNNNLHRLLQLNDLVKRLKKQLARQNQAIASKKTTQKKSSKAIKPPVSIARTLRYRLLQVLQSGQDKVYAVAISPDGQRLASAGTDNKLRLWDLQTYHLLKVLEGHSNWITDVQFSPTGKWLASSSWDGTIKIWDSDTGAQVRTLLGHKRQVRTLTYSPDGKLLASGGTSNSILLWDPKTGKGQGSFDGHINWIKDLEFSSTGKLLASASLDDTVRLWDINQGTLVRTLADHQAAVNTVKFSPDGHYLATASADTTIRMYPLPKGRSRVFSGHTEAINSIFFTPDSKYLVSGAGDGAIWVWNVKNGKTSQKIAAHDAAVTAITLSPNGARMVSAGADGKVKIWEPYLGK